MSAARGTRVAGPLHHLVLSIPHDQDDGDGPSSSYHFYSTEVVEHGHDRHHGQGRSIISAPGASVVQLSPSKRQRMSMTPSPQKSQRIGVLGTAVGTGQNVKLVKWVLRVCQQVSVVDEEAGEKSQSPEQERSAAVLKSDARADDAFEETPRSNSSDTESDIDEQPESPTDEIGKGTKAANGRQTLQPPSKTAASGSKSRSPESEQQQARRRVTHTAWYTAIFDADRAKDELQGGPSKQSAWSEVERRIKAAWDAGRVDVGAQRKRTHSDGTHSRIQARFSDEESSASSSKANSVTITLDRIEGADELNEASAAAVELMQAFGVLSSKTQQLMTERAQRKTMYEGKKQRAKEGTRNPMSTGRIRRKLVDDEGFEGEDDEE